MDQVAIHEATEELIASTPHALFTRIAALGYRLDHHHSDGPSSALRDLIVRVFESDCIVAEADFSDDGFAAHCQNVRVEEGHRRRGLATAMYLLAERVFGKPLWDFWRGDGCQSDAAKAMWAQPDRPFGQPVESTGGRATLGT